MTSSIPAVPALGISEAELMQVLKNSLYPGAKEESIKLVIGYCKAAGLDPMQKPVHIVPMPVSTGQKDRDGWDIKETRDVIMPGIGLYRTQAARTGEYAGISEPEFGEDVVEKLGEVEMTYPRWCKVTVRRIVQGHVVEFTAREFWKENYATRSAKVTEPNAMWKRRPYGQLAKCAEGQSLRKAFPELGAQPTADEMEGKFIDAHGMVVEEIEPEKMPVVQPQSKSKPAAKAAETLPAKTANGNGDDPVAGANIIAHLRRKLVAQSVPEADACKKFGLDKLEDIRVPQANECLAWLNN